jgi:Flp pilus assembly CpaF family ATPase
MAPDVAVVGEVRDREALPELLSHVGAMAAWR